MTPSDLQQHISDEIGIPFPTVAVYARFLREGNFLTRAGRGRSAPRMTPRDAAMILVSICGSEGPRDACETVKRFMDLVLDDHSREGVLGFLPVDGGMVGVVSSLIEGLISGSFQARARAIGYDIDIALEAIQIRFHMNGPTCGEVYLHSQAGAFEARRYFVVDENERKAAVLGRISYVDGRPLARIAEAFRRDSKANG